MQSRGTDERHLRVKIGKVAKKASPHILVVWSGDGRKDHTVADFGPQTAPNYALARRMLDCLNALETVNPIHVHEIFERLGALLRCHEQVNPAPEGPLRGEIDGLRAAVGRCGTKWEPLPPGVEVVMVATNRDRSDVRVHGEAGAKEWVEARLAATIGAADDPEGMP